MANTKSAKKAIRVSARRRLINVDRAQKVKDAIKSLSVKNDAENTPESFSKLQSVLDKAIKTGFIHKNNASRIKSKIAKRIK